MFVSIWFFLTFKKNKVEQIKNVLEEYLNVEFQNIIQIYLNSMFIITASSKTIKL